MAKKPVVTRFAPSPTGALHIGGARTALFNWLYARANGGEFLLRIEDTDTERSQYKHTKNIVDGLRWLGLNWGDKYIKQSNKQASHNRVAQQMLLAGTAYKCFATQEEIDKKRTINPREPFISPWRDMPEKKHPDAPYAIRLYVPQNDIVSIEDAVQKKVQWGASEFNDMVLLRSDGTPTYTLAVVVDDHDMGITHVIRGDDHLINAGKQKLIYDALGWDCPVFAHIPLIHGEDGKKLSKRHGATDLLYYAKQGYMPEAMRNTLTRLGWSHGNEELFTSEQTMKWFNLESIKKSPAQFNKKKLDSINAHYIKISDNDDFLDALIAYRRVKTGRITEYNYELKKSLRKVLPFLSEQDKGRKLSITWDNVQFSIMRRPIKIYGYSLSYLQDNVNPILSELTPVLTSANWEREDLMQGIKGFAEMQDMKLNELASYVRIALSGKKTGPSVISMLFFLGREESLARINDQINDQINK